MKDQSKAAAAVVSAAPVVPPTTLARKAREVDCVDMTPVDVDGLVVRKASTSDIFSMANTSSKKYAAFPWKFR